MSQQRTDRRIIAWSVTCDRCGVSESGEVEARDYMATVAMEDAGWIRVAWESRSAEFVDRTLVDHDRPQKPWGWTDRDLCPECAAVFRDLFEPSEVPA